VTDSDRDLQTALIDEIPAVESLVGPHRPLLDATSGTCPSAAASSIA
jgi:hypothetical protein